MDEGTESVWRGKFKTLKQYYDHKYPKKYYTLSDAEYGIDPDEDSVKIEQYDWERQQDELVKCSTDFAYFCNKYIRVLHPVEGLINFVLFDYQRRVIDDFENHRFNIVSKFRQGGLSTVAVIWMLWRGLFRFSETLMLLSKADREAMATGDIATRAMRFLPEWLKPEMTAHNKHEMVFADTGTSLFFLTPVAARSKAITFLILDEAAFIPHMTECWKAMYPTISTGGSCIAISTVNGIGNWYEETYHKAQEGKNPFHIIELDYTEHPDYDDPKWVRETKANLGAKGWQQEVMRDFLGSGSTYINPDIIRELGKKALETVPIRKLFPEYNNHDSTSLIDDWDDKGALWVFKEPVGGRDYIMGVDAAEGVGEDGDNSCFQVIDAQTCEQVAEFYSNCAATDKFAKICEQVAIFYNKALLAVESIGSAGFAVVSKLQNDYHYDNLYYENANNLDRAGIKVNSVNRTSILECLQNRLLNKCLPIASTRFTGELDTFVWNKIKRRAEASRDKHDDAIFAMAHAVYVRDQVMRQPAFLPTDPLPDSGDYYKIEIYEQIKNEIMKGAPEDWVDPADRDMRTSDEDEDVFADFYRVRRPQDALLREFSF